MRFMETALQKKEKQTATWRRGEVEPVDGSLLDVSGVEEVTSAQV